MSDRRRVTVVTAVVATMMAAVGFAGFSDTEVFLPSVGKGPGVGVEWATTVWVANPGDETATVQFFFLPRGQANPSPAVFSDTVLPGETRRYADAMDAMFGASGFGALRVVADQRVIVNSRIYSAAVGASAADSAGQFFGATPRSFAVAAGQSTTLLGVYQTAPAESSDFRYNFGFVEASGGSATVRVLALAADGSELGAKDYPVRPYEPVQKNVADLLPGVDADNLRLVLEVVSGTGTIIAFGSGIANGSGDPSTFEMSYADELLAANASSITGIVAGDGLTGGGSSGEVELAVASAGITAAMIADGAVTAAAIGDDAVGGAAIAPGAVVAATSLETVSASDNGTAAASVVCACPSGFVVVGGGCEVSSASGTPRVLASRAADNGWRCAVAGSAGVDVVATCDAICLR